MRTAAMDDYFFNEIKSHPFAEAKVIMDLRGFYKEKREGERKECEGALRPLR